MCAVSKQLYSLQEMIIKVLIFTDVYFLIGVLATFLVNRNADDYTRKKRWTKYWVYFVIVHAMFLLICLQGYFFTGAALLIALTGLYELIGNYIKSPKLSIVVLTAGILLYAITSTAFVFFSFTDTRWILFVYFLVVVFDGFSQLCGQLFGRTKLTNVSPNKTIEGLAGGLIFTLLTALWFSGYLSLSPGTITMYAIVICISSLTGDLLASLYKRKVQIKDYSTLIPGHGGALDRFDSLIAAGAVSLLLFILT
jgi:phosphatidate cytidylyltransferase